ncbi:conserved membrane hypothetical protein [Pseudomonas sp. 8BK]|uniref:hypothetical protein n=1 Tax=Pseudomonas sp. 8BK TaxID=2653164 RepID=UPI0012F259D0|nr:hypothetical protein [Pseudomonas sp. 8BK]VXC20525.1 conserved membrane hypothetical protein [Pseudomonas sp. 8BK]
MEHSQQSEPNTGKSWAISLEGPVLVIFIITSIASIFYATYKLGAVGFLTAPLIGTSVFGVAIFGLTIVYGTKNSWLPRIWNAAKAGLLAFISTAFLLVSLTAIGMTLLDALEYTWKHLSHGGKFSFVVALSTFLTGVFFFVFRLKWRVTYGVSEAMAGIAIATLRAHDQGDWWPSNDVNFYVIILTAGVYLVVRGLDNIHQGLGQTNDPMLRLFKFLLAQVYTDDPEKVAKQYDGIK